MCPAKQSGQLQRGTPMGLDLIARLLRDQRWRHDDAVDVHPSQLAVQRVAGRSGLVGHAQLHLRAAQPRHKGANRGWIVRDAPVAGWRTRFLSNRRTNGCLVHIQTDVANLTMVHHGHWADLHVCSSTLDELRPPAQPTLPACAGPSIVTSRGDPPLNSGHRMFLQLSGKCVMAMTFGTLVCPIAKRIARSATSCGGWGREGVRSEARAKQRLAPGGRAALPLTRLT